MKTLGLSVLWIFAAACCSENVRNSTVPTTTSEEYHFTANSAQIDPDFVTPSSEEETVSSKTVPVPNASKLNFRDQERDVLSMEVEVVEMMPNTTKQRLAASKNDSINDVKVDASQDGKLTDEERSYFLTFEEWKKQKVAEAQGKQPEGPPGDHSADRRKNIRRAASHRESNNLDAAVGEEGEFEADMFSDGDDNNEEGRTYKGRYNYASFDCAATIVKTNSEAKGANAVLNENKDTYLLNQCKAANKFVIIELCEDILVDEVMIGNYEFFSSVFKDIRVSVSDRFPSNNWKSLGEFKAENIRQLQSFKVTDPRLWAKFIKIEVLSYYGHEYYCPISSVQVHGKTMMEQFKDENHETEFDVHVASHQNDDTLSESPEFAIGIQKPALEQTGNGNPVTVPKPAEEEDDSDDFEDCIIKPHLGLQQFLEGFQQQQSQCNVNETDTDTDTEVATTYKSPSQESIYKNIVNRISLLEKNATLSLLYIEEQSKILSKAFDNLETRQSSQFDKLLNQLNATVHMQAFSFNRMNTELSSNFEQLFDYQNSRFQDLLNLYDQRLGSFQRSLNYQKMMNLFNFILIASLISYIVATREGGSDDKESSPEPILPPKPLLTPSKLTPLLTPALTPKKEVPVTVTDLRIDTTPRNSRAPSLATDGTGGTSGKSSIASVLGAAPTAANTTPGQTTTTVVGPPNGTPSRKPRSRTASLAATSTSNLSRNSSSRKSQQQPI